MKKIKTIILVAFLSALHFFSTLDAYAQIVIEERIEVNPKVKAPNTPNNPAEPTFTYILSWPPDQYRRGKIQTISCYGDTTDTGWTSGGYVTTSLSGSGHHIFKFVNERWYYDSHLGWGWYYDSNNDIERKVLINNQELNTGSLIGASTGTIDIPLLRFNDNICDSGFVKLEVEPTNWADCEEIGWLPIDQLNLRITSGSEFASFYNIRTGTNLGSQTQINPFVEMENLSLFFGFEWEKDGLDDVIIMLNENVPADSVPVYIEVEAEINGVEFAGGDIFYPDKPLIITEINPYEITTGEETLISVEVFNRCEPIDPFTTINLEIISGEEFGSFIDPYTDEKVKTITDLYLFWGYAWIDYVADGISSNETAEVKIRISTSSSGIPPKEVTIYIKPPPIYAYTVPEVLGADDSADVIIKKRNPDGTLEDFPADQTFELAVLDGCVNGNFMVGDSISNYFADALQPIKFVTADSLDSEVDSVLIRVGTDIEGYMRPIGNIKGEEEKDRIERESRLDTLRAGFEKMIAEKKAEVEKNKIGEEPPIEAPIVTQCALDQSNKEFNFNKNVVVGDECDDYKCDENYVQHFPAIRLDVVPPDYAGFDYCNNLPLSAVGVTDLLFDWEDSDPEKKGKLLVPFKVEELCFDEVNNYWNYNIVSKNKSEFNNVYDRWDSFYLRVVSTVCLAAYANSGTDFTLIHTLEELDEKVSVENVCLALQDFEYNRPYASDPLFEEELHNYIQTRNNTSGFKFCEIVPADTMHEYVHYRNIEEEIISTLNIRVPELSNKKYSTLFKHVELQCEPTNTPESVETEIRNQYNNIWDRFRVDLKERDDKRAKDPRNENNTQWNPIVQNHITKYQDEIKRIYPGAGYCSIIEITRRDI
jgi:hypothetical protein